MTNMSKKATRLFRRSRLSPRDGLTEYHGACRNGSFEHGAFWTLVKTENSRVVKVQSAISRRQPPRVPESLSAATLRKDVLILLSLPTPENPE